MRQLFVFVFCFLALPLIATDLPNHYIFQAMKDEMQRTQKDLRVKGQPNPFFIVYRVNRFYEQEVFSSMGKSLPSSLKKDGTLSAQVYMYVGNEEKNNTGFDKQPISRAGNIPQSYEGLRNKLWLLTDKQYKQAFENYQQKEDTKAERGIYEKEPNFSFSDKGSYVENIPSFIDFDQPQYQSMVDELSAMFKEYGLMDSSYVVFSRTQAEHYFLDSEGDFYQYADLKDAVNLYAKYTTPATGHTVIETKNIELSYNEPIDREKLKQQVREFLEEIKKNGTAKEEKKPYIGPVLFSPKAASLVLSFYFRDIESSKPFFNRKGEFDYGKFSKKMGMRVISPLFDVYDKPFLRKYQDKSLFFSPLDDEGVKPEELKLVEKGKLIALPTARSPLAGQQKSNGHAFFKGGVLPRAKMTNLFFIPQKTFTKKKLEKTFLKKCKKAGLEYCYIVPSLGEYVDKVYVKDGRKERVRMNASWGLIPASEMRRIESVGDDMQVHGNIVTPSFIVEEVEVFPIETSPTFHRLTKPFGTTN